MHMQPIILSSACMWSLRGLRTACIIIVRVNLCGWVGGIDLLSLLEIIDGKTIHKTFFESQLVWVAITDRRIRECLDLSSINDLSVQVSYILSVQGSTAHKQVTDASPEPKFSGTRAPSNVEKIKLRD